MSELNFTKKLYHKINAKLQRYSIGEIHYRRLDAKVQLQQKKRMITSNYEFIDRSGASDNLLIIVAGFQEFYWDAVFERVKHNQEMFDEALDVCICVPGEDGALLKKYAKKYNWSYLRIKKDLLAQAQNTAIHLHKNAKWIYKIDEDILISDNYFSKLKSTFLTASTNHNKEIGFVAPLINLNACGVECFLKSINKFEDFEKEFGKLKIGMMQPIHRDEKVGEWIWNYSIPFDEIAKDIEKVNANKYFECSIRFSVGAILLKRSFWEEIGGFLVKGIGYMGGEEEQMNAFCMNQMKSIIVAEDTFAGHLGFFHQKQACHDFFDKHQNELRLNK